MSNSWKPEVQMGDSGKWYGNGLRFASHEEALQSARDLSYRWVLVRDYRAVESDDRVNYEWADGGLKAVQS